MSKLLIYYARLLIYSKIYTKHILKGKKENEKNFINARVCDAFGNGACL